jgi:hypothetical protein
MFLLSVNLSDLVCVVLISKLSTNAFYFLLFLICQASPPILGPNPPSFIGFEKELFLFDSACLEANLFTRFYLRDSSR